MSEQSGLPSKDGFMESSPEFLRQTKKLEQNKILLENADKAIKLLEEAGFIITVNIEPGTSLD